MTDIVKGIWLFLKNGKPLLELLEENDVNKDLIGKFISALKSFSSEISGKELKSFTIEKNKYICTSILNDNVIIVCRCLAKTDDKTMNKIMEIIKKIIINSCDPSILKNWNGDERYLTQIREKIDLYFKLGNL
ncbi:MAG: hypothetical protein ACTSXH_17405 [Promethearchaeota archaeon]